MKNNQGGRPNSATNKPALFRPIACMKKKSSSHTFLLRVRVGRILRIFAFLLLFAVSPLFPQLVSVSVMSVYSRLNEKDSLITQKDIRLHIPGGFSTARSDWYPFVMNYEAGTDFGYCIDRPDVSLTILYNFPAFDSLKGCSRLYDASSPYYSSFYGAYLVEAPSSHPYGFCENELGELVPDAKDVARVPKYDFFELVLSEFGLAEEEGVFDWQITDIKKEPSYAGENDFYRMDALLTVNGCAHNDTGFTPSYLQYGRPYQKTDAPLAPVTLFGRLYGKYLPEKNTSVFFYIVAASKEVLEDCDRNILSHSTLSFSKN